jgi:apolipoprotein N-acyltransferase
VLGWGDSWRARVRPIGALVLVLGAATLLGPGRFSQPNGTLTVTLLQGNVAQDEKFALAQMPQALAWTSRHLLAARGDLVVAPETVIPLLPSQLDAGYWQTIAEHFQRGPQAALLGLPLGDPAEGYTNSAAGISAATAALPNGFYRYDKHHLVPFGEFIPLGFRWFTELMSIPLGDFNRGPVGAPSFAFRGERIGANICYEDLFGEELAARFEPEANAPTIFANMSNIGWFGDTVAIAQHLEISRMRTLELQRPMLRATNTGATAVIDHTGRVTASLPRLTQGVLDSQVQGRTGLTPFAWWASRFGLWPLWLLGGLIVASAGQRRAAPKRPAHPLGG